MRNTGQLFVEECRVLTAFDFAYFCFATARCLEFDALRFLCEKQMLQARFRKLKERQ